MELKLLRYPSISNYTEGKLYINGAYFCDTLEDQDRGLYLHMSLAEIKAVKVYGETCIPYGTYKIELSYSPKFKRILPEVLNVKGFTGIRIHEGNTIHSTSGCLILGTKSGDGVLKDSRKAVSALIEKLTKETDITIIIDYVDYGKENIN